VLEALLCCVVGLAAPGASEDAHAILVARCIRCHGGVRERGDLNLLRRERAVLPRAEGRPAIVPGDPDASELLARIASHDADERMPPEGPALTDAEVGVLRRWIAEGAAYPTHWSMAPVAPVPPPDAGGAWATNAIDRFTAARLQRAGIALPAAADRRALLRRASLDLCGLPPDQEAVAAFLADGAPGAWERAVDRLLASPAYGERWARIWLDLARYADTKGYEKDDRRQIWAFRDWLIDAWNVDMPYDAFTVRLLAGDLLPGATDADRVATAFHRNTLTNDEGGTDDEEFRTAAVMDRTATTWNVWMGTSMQCVQCHSHPYDPIDHREYYEALAFFNQTADADRADDAPVLRLSEADGKETSVPVMQELPADRRRETCVFTRGNWRARGERVTAGVPGAFPAMPADAPRDRLGLARWIVDPGNPRAARVEVNRLWEALFGRGLVETSEEFGAAGERPADASQLDWLASRFVQLGWSRKSLLREILASSTYRMTAVPGADALAHDPDNRLMSRAPRFRLEAEVIRDQALAVSGLLECRLHGPPVFPYQPDGVWMVVYSGDQWKTSDGPDRWRRAIYTFWRRSSPHPSLVAFDATSRESCTVRRVRTNTPLAALVALNDPTYVEASRALAVRALRSAGPGPATDDRAVARAMLTLALVREPRAAEIDRLAVLVADERTRFAADPAAAAAMAGESGSVWAAGAGTGALADAAAWTAAAAVVLNMDEFLTRT
jgi:hypothetical protein